MIHNAIYALHPNVVSIKDSDDGTSVSCYDADGVLVTFTTDEQTAINTKSSELATTENLQQLRLKRNAKLAETDWTQSRDVTLTNDAEWATYRQALRDITDTYSDLDSVVWPTKPE